MPKDLTTPHRAATAPLASSRAGAHRERVPENARPRRDRRPDRAGPRSPEDSSRSTSLKTSAQAIPLTKPVARLITPDIRGQIQVHRALSISDSPPASVFSIETSPRGNSSSEESPGEETRARREPPPRAPGDCDLAPEGATAPRPDDPRRRGAPLSPLLNPHAEAFVPTHEATESPPPYPLGNAREDLPAPCRRDERGPGDLFLYTEPIVRPIPPLSPAPYPRDVPRSHRGRGASRASANVRRVIPPPLPTTGSLRRDRAIDIERLIYMHPFIRDALFEVKPHIRLIPLDAPGQAPVFQVDGYRENLPQYSVNFMHALTRPLVTGQRLNVWTRDGARDGELIVVEDLRREHRDTNLLAFWISPPRIAPVVVKLPQTSSHVLMRQDLFLAYEIGLNPAIILEELMHRTDLPERWNHIFNNTRRYTLAEMLRESGREDLLAQVPDWLWGIFVAPPEGQLTTQTFLYALSTPGREAV